MLQPQWSCLYGSCEPKYFYPAWKRKLEPQLSHSQRSEGATIPMFPDGKGGPSIPPRCWDAPMLIVSLAPLMRPQEFPSSGLFLTHPFLLPFCHETCAGMRRLALPIWVPPRPSSQSFPSRSLPPLILAWSLIPENPSTLPAQHCCINQSLLSSSLSEGRKKRSGALDLLSLWFFICCCCLSFSARI